MIGLAVLVGTYWDGLANWSRLAILGGAAIGFFVAGVLLVGAGRLIGQLDGAGAVGLSVLAIGGRGSQSGSPITSRRESWPSYSV